MTIQTYFDKVYCINIPSREDRWEESQEEFLKHGIDNVTKVEGITGIPTGLQHHETMGLNQRDINFQKKIAGTVGCLLSHLKIIKEAKAQHLSKILILEDDVQFSPQMQETFARIYNQIPLAWTLLYLGGNELSGAKQVSSNIIQVSHMLMTHAVAIHCSIYDDLIQMLEECAYPVDVYYTMIQKKHACYSIYPYIAWQRASWSDIEQRFRIYDFENMSHSLTNILQCKIIE
ncbi:MAG TPA: glycosyltransferase family 25 protein [Chitinophaga sp.]|uniref:glycosyltransferase family 25 protein n=1 Tax=Chitinophaga sp. TaxID=1869181 RepID=UPI002BCDA1C2|nr:glycosyltransferase family 25 protein [Chitinophaga sp.]HVI43861.1 glycosyltransferase family 25 protein [Chitinophaga sp.]